MAGGGSERAAGGRQAVAPGGDGALCPELTQRAGETPGRPPPRGIPLPPHAQPAGPPNTSPPASDTQAGTPLAPLRAGAATLPPAPLPSMCRVPPRRAVSRCHVPAPAADQRFPAYKRAFLSPERVQRAAFSRSCVRQPS